MIWMCGGALAFNVLMILGVLALLAFNGLSYFWQRPIALIQTTAGQALYGEIHERERMPELEGVAGDAYRIRVKVGNRDLTGRESFVWLPESEIAELTYPDDASVIERLEWGNFYGKMLEIKRGDELIARDSDSVWDALQPLHEEKLRATEKIHGIEKGAIGDVNHRMGNLNLRLRALELDTKLTDDERARRKSLLDAELAEADRESAALQEELFALRDASLAEVLVMATADGQTQNVPVAHIVRPIRPNTMSIQERSTLYLSRLWEFISDDPRESNTEGGIFPAIFGTVMMVFLMSVAVVPFGILAALYLREYARQGFLVRVVRTAVNNLAGVPSIVFGVFGLGFFVYLVGGTVDQLFFPEALPTATYGTGGILWASLTLAILTVPVVIVATEEGLAAVPRIVREGSLALGATKFETTWRVVLPAAAPGILTGIILSMARAAGEVAPLMIVGMVKLAPALPIDHHFPFVHLERKFMHLGFHIYDVGLQSPDVEAVKPLVFATAFLLVLVVTVMNIVAFSVRNHLRQKYATSTV